MTECTEVTKIKEVNGTDLLRVKFQNDTGDTTIAYWFYSLAEAMKYVNKEVLVDFRQEPIDGNIEYVINTFTIPTQVNTLTKDTNIKLYSNAEDNFATVSFNDLSEDEELPNACLYCISQEIRSSEKATWIEYTVRDKLFRVAKLRLFDYDSAKFDYAGGYVMVSPLMKSRYGFSCNVITKATGEVPVNPEITIAQTYIKNYFANNIHALSCIDKFKLFEHLNDHMDYERGYGVVRLATELAIAEQLTNITDNINSDIVKEAILASYLYVTQPNSVLSPLVRNCMLAARHEWTDKKLLVQIIDVSDEPPVERYIYKNIKDMANTVIKVNKEPQNAHL